LTALWCLVALVSACSGPRLAESTGPPASALASAAVTADNPPQPPPQITPPPLGDQRPPQSPGNQPPPQPPSDQQPSATAAAVPTGEPAQPKRKPKPKHRRKPREEPKQLLPPSGDTTPMSPPGAVINAQVGEIGIAVMSILGKKVQGPKGEDLGRVVDVLADATGRVRVAIIDFGGFLGVGTRRIAVDWPLLRFDPAGDKPLILSLSREKLQSAPEYKDSGHPRVLMPPAVSPSAPADTPETKK
jgi:hypothetical protein